MNIRNLLYIVSFMVIIICITVLFAGCVEEPESVNEADHANNDSPEVSTPERKAMFYDVSLHATTGGMEKIYNEGFKQITGIDYFELDCYHCHATCDDCHAMDVNGNKVYETAVAADTMTCLKCHGREGIIANLNIPDMHSTNNLTCTDCHTAEEIHGMGVEIDTMKDPETIAITCEDCHYSGSDKATPPSGTISHTAHGEKLDCSACHVGTSVTCYNCHFDTYLEYEQKIALPTKDWLFLLNYNGKVASANIMPLSYGKQTYAIFAPQFPHNVINPGRSCGDCHGNENVLDLDTDSKITLSWWDEGFKHKTGIIPVLDPETYEYELQFLWLDYNPDTEEKIWSQLDGQEKPIVKIGNYGEPLTLEQLQKLKNLV